MSKLSFKCNLTICLLAVLTLGSCINRGVVKNAKVEKNIKLDQSTLEVSVVASGLNVPWEISWGPDNNIWITEQHGEISKINPVTGEKKLMLRISEVWNDRTSGLLGMAIHPDFKSNPYVFVSYTVKQEKNVFSKLMRYTVTNDTLINAKQLLVVPGSNGHNGARVAISPKGKVLWATGDAQKSGNAQNIKSLNGKVLRLNVDGSIPDDNPFENSYVWAMGFRNMQGLTFSKRGFLYTSEHGDALEDEVNLITSKGNYGWPNIEGLHDTDGEKKYAALNQTIEPIKSWTPTIAPSGITYYGSSNIPEWNNSLLLTTLKGRSLRILKLSSDGTGITDEFIAFENEYGRLRSVCVSPEGDIYFSTSNRDWNPYSQPLETDDRILRIRKVNKKTSSNISEIKKADIKVVADAAQLYGIYCASCHKPDGTGIQGTFPALAGSAMVNGDKNTLIKAFLKGIKTEGKPEQMPSFKFLSDQEGAAILSYIRKEWGNKGDQINDTDIKLNR